MPILDLMIKDFRAMWGNGTKHLLIAFMFLMGSVFLFVSVSIAAYYINAHRTTFAPLDYPSPQRVLNPIVHPGDTLNVVAVKCNNSSSPVSVQAVGGTPYLRNLDTQEITTRPGPRLGAYSRAVGCLTLTFENPLPDLAPGRYVMEGVEVATKGALEQREAWNTEPFCITDQEGEGC